MFSNHLRKSLSYSLSRRFTSAVAANSYDLTIVGGGIVGCASAREIQTRYPDMKICVVEKEDILAAHQSGHNSGVIHAGLYYQPGSFKAKLCREGLVKSYEYFDKHKIPYKKCGKLVVATSEGQLGQLDNIIDRSTKNGVNFEVVDADGIRQVEPNCRGVRAIHSPDTGIVDWGYVCRFYGKEFQGLGGTVKTNFEVNGIGSCTNTELGPEYKVTVTSKDGQQVHSKNLITCAGLYADKVAGISGGTKLPKIVPFRGDYLLLKPEKCDIVKGNIYPVPDPNFPFLGVHFTPRMDGSVWLGPNAFLAFKREGYNLTDFSAKEFYDSVTFPGTWKLILKNIMPGVREVSRYAIMSLQVKELQKFIPAPIFTINDVTRGPAGVRAQALDDMGNLVDDFIFDSGSGPLASHTLHIRNAPSPAATSSLAIARVIAEKAEEHFKYTSVE